jgi:hypothetical protein
VGPQRLFLNRQGALVERLGLGVLPLGRIEARQAVEALRHGGMGGPQHLFPNRQGALVERFGLGIFPLGPIQFP